MRKKKIHARKSYYKGRILRDVSVEDVTLPNGVRILLERIEHPGAAAVVPFLGRNRIILLRQYRAVIDKYIWEIPAGKLDDGERPLTCARRELREETGYKARSFSLLTCIYTTPGFTTERIHIYKATGLSRASGTCDHDEILTPSVFTPGQIRRMIRTRRITDSKTITGLGLCGVL